MSAAVCPHPPALVPEVSQGAAGLFDDVRAACVACLRAVTAVPHDALVCVGPGPRTARWGRTASGTLQAFGVAVSYGGGDAVLPPALTVARYLLDRSGVTDVDCFQAVESDAPPDACRALGAELAAVADRVTLVVMGDASAKLTAHSPGYLDLRAEQFDAELVRALGTPDPAALLRIDPTMAGDLWVAGRSAWQVLAGALALSPMRLRGRVEYDGAPLGVGYVVVRLAEPA